MGLNFLGRVISASVLLSCSVTTGALAQPEAFEPCRAVETSDEEAGAAILYVLCDGAATGLGRVESYELINLPDLNAAIAVTTFDGTERTWMLIRGDAGPVLEEITGSIARIADAGKKAGIENLNSDPASSLAQSAKPVIGSPSDTGALFSAEVAALVARSRSIARTAEVGEVDQ